MRKAKYYRPIITEKNFDKFMIKYGAMLDLLWNVQWLGKLNKKKVK